MKKIKFGDFEDFESSEFFETIISGTGAFRLERILSKSARSPDGFWYDQPEFELAIVLEGSAEIEDGDGKVLRLEKFEAVAIPPHFKHRVAKTSEHCMWLALFAPRMDLARG